MCSREALIAIVALLLASACGEGGEPPATATPTGTSVARPEPTVALSGTAVPTEARTGPPGTPARDKIAFVSGRAGGDNYIHVMNADGSGLIRLTSDPVVVGFEFGPAWSPDGTRIAFVSYYRHLGEVYVVNADGSGLTNLTNHLANDVAPTWSSDGSRIAFVSNRDGNDEVYVMNADGSGLTNLTNSPAADQEPAWSPDGTRIAFTSDRGGNPEIHVMGADGSGLKHLTSNPVVIGFDFGPAWSPDGTRIAFVSFRGEQSNVYVVNADGSALTNLTNDLECRAPTWSPDGTRIAFVAYPGEVYVMDAAGAGLMRVFDEADYDHPLQTLTWSPDGNRIAFLALYDIYVISADGSGLINLTNSPTLDGGAAWSPVP